MSNGDDLAYILRLARAAAWDEGYYAGWSDGGDANTAGLDEEDEHTNPYRQEAK